MTGFKFQFLVNLLMVTERNIHISYQAMCRIINYVLHFEYVGTYLGCFVLERDNAALNHLVVEIVALAGPLADASEHGVAAVSLGHVVDQLHDEYGLAHAGAAEETDLAALHVGGQQVHDLGTKGCKILKAYQTGAGRIQLQHVGSISWQNKLQNYASESKIDEKALRIVRITTVKFANTGSSRIHT